MVCLVKVALMHRSFTNPGLEIKCFFSREHNCIFKSYLNVLCIETSAFLGSLQKFDGGAGEFNGAPGSRLTLISSPGILPLVDRNMLDSISAFMAMLVVNIREYIQYFIGLKHALNTLTLLGS